MKIFVLTPKLETSKPEYQMVCLTRGRFVFSGGVIVGSVSAGKPEPLLSWQNQVHKTDEESQILKRAVEENWGREMWPIVKGLEKKKWLIPIDSGNENEHVYTLPLSWADILENIRMPLSHGGVVIVSKKEIDSMKRRRRAIAGATKKGGTIRLNFQDMDPEDMIYAKEAYSLIEQKEKENTRRIPRGTYSS